MTTRRSFIAQLSPACWVAGPLTAAALALLAQHARHTRLVSRTDMTVLEICIALVALSTGLWFTAIGRDMNVVPAWLLGIVVPGGVVLAGCAAPRPDSVLGVLFLTVVLGVLGNALPAEARPAPRVAERKVVARRVSVVKAVPVEKAAPVVKAVAAVAACQVCGDVLAHGVVSCTACETPCHADCWRYAGACSTYGCGCRIAA